MELFKRVDIWVSLFFMVFIPITFAVLDMKEYNGAYILGVFGGAMTIYFSNKERNKSD